MDKQHPHFGAEYKIAQLTADTFDVGVTIPGAQSVNVSGFASEEMARAWIASHERDIAVGTMAREKLHIWAKPT